MCDETELCKCCDFVVLSQYIAYQYPKSHTYVCLFLSSCFTPHRQYSNYVTVVNTNDISTYDISNIKVE